MEHPTPGKTGWGIGLGLGFILGWTYAQEALPYTSHMLLAFFVAAGIGFAFPQQAWRWGVAVTLGALAGDVIDIIVDVRRDPTAHNLWPLEIAFLAGATLLSASAGAYAGTLLRGRPGEPDT